MRPESPLAHRLPDVAPGRLRPPDPDDPVFRAFLAGMPLGNRAEDYAVQLLALEGGVELPDQAAYDAFKAGLDAGWLEAFHRRYYEVRGRFQEGDPGGWLGLIRLYPDVAGALPPLARSWTLAVATARDRESVDRILRRAGLRGLFREELVLDKETGVSKASHLGEILRRTGAEPDRTVFVDDKVSHLDAAAATGVRCALATWGYNGEREVRLARERGYALLRPGDLPAQLEALVPPA
ncbi:MAG: HAD family hydrolase [Nitrospirae bacterium]|nr:MAG: HAD family hydrolase [Nitrospirota bacterium]